MTALMEAVQIQEYGGPDVLNLCRLPIPTPSEGEVVVKVMAAGVGPWDAWIRAGKSVLPQPLPLTPGSDIAGVVVEVGPGDVRGAGDRPPPGDPGASTGVGRDAHPGQEGRDDHRHRQRGRAV